MSFQSFNLDVDSAKKADSEGGRINRTDKYVGIITRAEFVISSKGTQGIEIAFETADKQDATCTFWTFKADNTPIFGRDKINAIMACTGTRTLTPTDKQLEKYSYDAGGKVMQLCTVAPELEGKAVGFLIQMEEYLNGNGELKTRPNFVSAFNPSNGLMAKEILERKTTPEALEKAYARLMKGGDKKLPVQQQSSGYSNNVPYDDSDSLPF